MGISYGSLRIWVRNDLVADRPDMSQRCPQPSCRARNPGVAVDRHTRVRDARTVSQLRRTAGVLGREACAHTCVDRAGRGKRMARLALERAVGAVVLPPCFSQSSRLLLVFWQILSRC